jgi:hypothetical protein
VIIQVVGVLKLLLNKIMSGCKNKYRFKSLVV